MIALDTCACCGSQVKTDQPFCDNCGLVLRSLIDPQTDAHTPDMLPSSDFPTQVLPAREQPDYRFRAAPPPAPRRRLGPLLCVAGALVVIGCGVLGVGLTGPMPACGCFESHKPPTVTLPTLTPDLAYSTAQLSAAAAAVQVLQTRAYTDTSGTLTFVGVARNMGAIPLQAANIGVSLRDGRDTLLATGQSANYSVPLIQPGAIMPFQLSVPAAPDQWATARWQTSGQAPHGSTARYYRDLQVTDAHLLPPGAGVAPRWTLIGQVQNSGTLLAQFVEVRAGLYTADGTILDVAQTEAEVNVLAPGGSVPFAMEFSHVGKQIPDRTHYDLWVAGR